MIEFMNTRCIIIVILLALNVGCEKFSLEEQPKTFYVTEQFFRNEEDAQAALASAYQAFFSSTYYGRWMIGVPELFSDYVNGKGGQAKFSKYAITTTETRIRLLFGDIYIGINRANLVLNQVPEIDMDAALKAQILGEACFIRALNYYNLVRAWGPVPLRTEPLKGFAATAAKRSPVEDVYNLILEDLKFAEDNLPSSYTSQSEIGRATKWAAKTLLADVYLTREAWEEAAAKAKEVIDSKQFALVQVSVSDDFLQIWGPDVVTSSEEIFAIHFTANAGCLLPTFLHIATAGYSVGGYYSWQGDMNSWIKDWDINDLRRNFNMYNGDDLNWLPASVQMLFKKYRDVNAPAATEAACDVLPLRYADCFLIFAEATSQANNGPTIEAYEAANRIRRRAYGVDLDTPDPSVDLSPGMSAQEFQDAILQERAYEFCMEGKRWFDLIRTGKALEVIQSLGKPITERDLLWPIPQQEIDNNDALTEADQNPGW